MARLMQQSRTKLFGMLVRSAKPKNPGFAQEMQEHRSGPRGRALVVVVGHAEIKRNSASSDDRTATTVC